MLRLTAQDLKPLGIIDDIIPEPAAGAHANIDAAAQAVREHLRAALVPLRGIAAHDLLDARYQKYRRMGKAADGNHRGAV